MCLWEKLSDVKEQFRKIMKPPKCLLVFLPSKDIQNLKVDKGKKDGQEGE